GYAGTRFGRLAVTLGPYNISMRIRAWVVAGVWCALALLVVPLLAKDIADLCGTYVGRTQREMLLHRLQTVEQGRERLNQQQQGEAAPAPPATISQDVGQIAVI